MASQFYDVQMCGGAPFQIVDMCSASPFKQLDTIFRAGHGEHSKHHHPKSIMSYTGGSLRRRHVGSKHRRSRRHSRGGSLNPIGGLMTGNPGLRSHGYGHNHPSMGSGLNPVRSLMTGGGSRKHHVGSRKHRSHRRTSRKSGGGRQYIHF